MTKQSEAMEARKAQVRIARAQRGISYLEVLIAVAVIAVSAVPVSTAFFQSLKEAEFASLVTVRHFHRVAKMEEMLSLSYKELLASAVDDSTPSSLSDATGTTDRRLVYISAYDGDNADRDNDGLTGGDSDLLLIRVETEYEARVLHALKAR